MGEYINEDNQQNKTTYKLTKRTYMDNTHSEHDKQHNSTHNAHHRVVGVVGGDKEKQRNATLNSTPHT